MTPHMPTIHSTPPGDLPSSRTLLKSTLIALAVAALLLVTVVLPAEYAIDPTGVGRVLGLTEMGEIKMQLAREAAAEDSVAASAPAAAKATAAGTPAVAAAPEAPAGVSGARADTVAITLQPNQGREIKLAMRQGERVRFTWATNRGAVNFDTHADRTAPPAIKYHGYEKGQGVARDSGVLVAAFDGMHGWFWRNRSREPLTVTLQTSGAYTELKEVK
jgi:hypothetical protein